MTDREITELVRTLELDLNKILQEFYHQKPPALKTSTWAQHALHLISKKTLNAAMAIYQDTLKETT